MSSYAKTKALDVSCLDLNQSLGIDQACLTIFNQNKQNITFYAISEECYHRWCNGIPIGSILDNANASFLMPTKYSMHMWYERGQVKQEWCHFTFTFKEHGFYGWNFTDRSCSDVYTIKEPDDSYLPILAAFMFFVLATVISSTSIFILRLIKGRLFKDNSNVHDDLARLEETESLSQPRITATKASIRNRSIDTFRGIAILLMIFVNNGGGRYFFFNHSAWNGLTLADLVLPWFAWIMGLTIMLSNRAEFRVSNSRGKIIIRCLRRSVMLIILGLIINSHHNQSLSHLRFPGVLQLLAISYFICATMEILLTKQHSENYLSQFGRLAFLHDILENWIQWLIMLAIVGSHLCLTFLFPVPNCPRGYLGPGGYDHRGDFVNCTGGTAGYIDRLVFGNHTYSNTENPIFGHILPHDPEGIMNTISAIFIVFLGMQAGRILQLYYQFGPRVIRWILWAVFTGLMAGILCNFVKNDGIIPVNKKMMTLSYVLITSSFAFLLFAALHFLVNHKRFWSGAPFVYAGTNPIFLYVGHYLTMGLFPWSWLIPREIETHMTVLAMNLWTTALWAFIAYLLHKKNIIITV